MANDKTRQPQPFRFATTKQLLNAPEFAARVGRNGREHVRTNFLLTRHLRDCLLLFLFLEHRDERVIRLP